MPTREYGPRPQTTNTKLVEAIREYGLEKMEFLREHGSPMSKSLFEVCSGCGYQRSQALVPERPSPPVCPRCKTDAPEIRVEMTFLLSRQ